MGIMSNFHSFKVEYFIYREIPERRSGTVVFQPLIEENIGP